MNTKVEFSTWTRLDRDKVHELFDKGFQQFHFVIEKFSRFNKDSELSRLNNFAGKEVQVSKELFSLIEFALKMAKKTNGIFDPTIIDFLEAYGYSENYSFEKLNNKKLIQREIQQILKTRASYKNIKLLGDGYRVRLHENQRIDLGSISKGYAIDRAFEKLKPLGNFLINAGGDIRAHGSGKNDKPWLVGLNVPKQGQIGSVRLDNQAICCSGSWARKVRYFHHLINPKTGNPQNKFKTTFVVANTAMEADAWSTALFVAGENAEKLIKKYKLKAIVVTDKEVKNYGINIFS
jgi:thiamine biosynthesis lipoprotein